MSELSPKARLLLDRAREAAVPLPADRTRVRALLRARLAPLPHPLATGPALAKGALVIVVAAAAVLASLRFGAAPSTRTVPAAVSPPPTRSVPPAVDRAVPAAPVEPARSVSPPAPTRDVASTGRLGRTRRQRESGSPVATPPPPAPAEAGAAPEAEPTAAEPPPPAPRPVSLTEELRVISSAQATLRRDPADSLRLTDEWAARFPRGALHEEALAVRILSLCALGRTAEAGPLTAQLLTGYPHTTYAPRVREACTSR
jgi:hypothetical protein